jgi:non-ribosomal peptide synthetase component F
MSPLPVLLHHHLDRRAARCPDGELAVPGVRRMTWAQAREASRRAARALDAAGLEPGDRFAVLARDPIEYLLLCVAASRAGVALVALDPRRTPAEWDRAVAESEALLLVCGTGFEGVRLPAMPVVGVGELWVTATPLGVTTRPVHRPGANTATAPTGTPPRRSAVVGEPAALPAAPTDTRADPEPHREPA